MIIWIMAGLAQVPESSGGGKYGEADVFMWGGILIGVVVVGSVFIMLLRRRMNAGHSSAQDAGFSLSDLRAMRDRGEITSDEYEQTRARVIAKVKSLAEKKKPAAGHKPLDETDLET
jgi:hypothetical protein